ncbi:MAG TPA: cytochrome c [Terriglobales bacterium]|nr:cytochrome c [Terriglobales bacterium]
MKLSRILLAAAVVTFATAAMAQEPDPQFVTLYKTKCAVCHGVDGKGDTAAGKKLNARDFRLPEIMKAPDAELIQITTKGKNKMPAFEKKLTDVQIKALVAYIRGLTKAKK